MRFSKREIDKFGAYLGAYSTVTDREYFDSQITITDYEAQIVTNFFGLSQIHTGSVQSDPNLSKKTFRLYPSGKNITLNLVFPKLEKPELRLYLSSRAGFKPDAGDTWFIFVKDAEIWVGALQESVWRT